MRTEYDEKGTGPTVRVLGKTSGVPVKELFVLFPKGPAKIAARIAETTSAGAWDALACTRVSSHKSLWSWNESSSASTSAARLARVSRHTDSSPCRLLHARSRSES